MFYRFLDNLREGLYKTALSTVLSLSLVLGGCGGGGGGSTALPKLKGKLTDLDKNPISNIEIIADNKTTETDKNGDYSFYDIDDGSYELVISDPLESVYKRR